MWTWTQSPSHALNSSIASAIIEQTPTKIFLPNAEADRSDYCEGFALSDREFKLVSEELEPGSRQFLVKQGAVSTVVSLDLAGFDYELAVISGRTKNLELMHELIARHGEAPELWLPHFRQAIEARAAPAASRASVLMPPPAADLTPTTGAQRHAA